MLECAESHAPAHAVAHAPSVVSCRWWAQWCAYTRYKQPPAADGDAAEAGSDSLAGGPKAPPPIDNSDIVFDSKLRDNLEEGTDFVIVSVGVYAVWLCRTQQARVHTHPVKSDASPLPCLSRHMSSSSLESQRRRIRVSTALASCSHTVVWCVCVCVPFAASVSWPAHTAGAGTCRTKAPCACAPPP